MKYVQSLDIKTKPLCAKFKNRISITANQIRYYHFVRVILTNSITEPQRVGGISSNYSNVKMGKTEFRML